MGFATLYRGLVFWGVCLALCASAQPASPPSNGPLTLPKNALLPVPLPFHTWRGVPIVEANVEGKGLESFALSTGLSGCTLPQSAYGRLSLQAVSRQSRVHVLDTIQTGQEVVVKTLRLQNLALESVPFALVDVQALLSRAPRGGAPTGWLGSPFFATFQVTFDFANQSLLLASPQSPLPGGAGAVVVPLEMQDGRPFVRLTVPGVKPFLALLDTATVGTLLPREVAEKLKLKPTQVVPVRQPNGKEVQVALVTLPSLRLGKAEQKDTRVLITLTEQTDSAAPSLSILGQDFLNHYKVTLNYAKRKMVLAPLETPSTEEP